MQETNFVESNHFKQKFRIHGNLSHDTSAENKQRWFIYLLEDIPCQKQIIGSTTNPTDRWRNHKAACNSGKSKSTGMAKHFIAEGCPNDPGRGKETLRMTLVDYMDVTKEELREAGHVKGPKCRCEQCMKLKDIEDRWILKMGTFYGEGLNSRDEIQSKTRCNW